MEKYNIKATVYSGAIGEKMKVSNPLTIIAIFSGLAETLATIALLGLPQELQAKFLYFVMAFPTLIVILFFIVLYFKNTVLYAPGDYQNPEHYLTINGSDIQQALESEISENNSIRYQREASGESIDIAKTGSKIAQEAIDLSRVITNDLLEPALGLLIIQLLEKPGNERDRIVNEIESEKLKEMLISILRKMKLKFGEDAYSKPMQPTAKAANN